MVYSVEKSLREHGDKISSEERAAIEQELNATKETLKGNDTSAIKAAKDKLTAASQKLGEAVYKAAQQAQQAQAGAQQDAAQGQPQGAGQANGATGADNVVDAEVVDDNNK